MYFVKKEKIEQTLQRIRELSNLFLEENVWQSTKEKLALERGVGIMIEGILDVGTMMIDGYILRDPGSYEDIIDILVDSEIVNEQTGKGIKNLLHYRTILVRDYLAIDHAKLIIAVKDSRKHVLSFIDTTLNFMKTDPNSVTAFGEKS